MSNPLIKLLLAYGPSPDGNAMYDEFVIDEAEKSGLDPLEFNEVFSGEICQMLDSENPVSVILTGTAGDGKTYTARQIFKKAGSEGWDNKQAVNLATLSSGRELIAIKDLSELSVSERDEWYPRIVDALEGKSNELFIICVNDGQLLSFFRERRSDPRAEAIEAELSRMLQVEAPFPSGDLNFRLIHMSRQSHAGALEDIFDKILNHEGWKACSLACEAQSNGKVCPILRNREVMKAPNNIFRQRIQDCVEIAAADDRHLALRQLIILTVNTLLGVEGFDAYRLMTCERAKSVAQTGSYKATNPYSNVLGYNHPQSTRDAVAVFDTLARLGIGEETTNQFDNALLDIEAGQELPQDEVHGIPIFEDIRNEYAEKPSEMRSEIREALRVQRRRLFFTMSEPQAKLYGDPWRLTKFHSAQQYLNLARELRGDGKPSMQTRGRITLGLNRTMTGYFTETDDEIWLTRPSGDVHGQSVPLLIDHPVPWVGRQTRAAIVGSGLSARPVELEIAENGQRLGLLKLSPTMFEFLFRVSNGAMPGSFGSQCLQEIRTFQITTNGALEHITREVGEDLRLQAIRLRPLDGALEAHPIQLLEAAQ